MTMAVFRINKTKSYTVMSNYHLRDKTLSCKACGLLSKMLSLPEDWDYTTRGLASICKDGLDSICSALKELEAHGYLERRRLRDSKGMLKDVEYLIFEQPHPKPEPPAQDNPDTEEPEQENPRPGNPDLDEPDMENPRQEKPAQLNTEKQNTKKPKTNQSNTDSFLPSAPSAEPAGETDEKAEGQTDGTAVRERIKQQIEYDVMVRRTSRAQMDELVELMVEVEMNRSPTVRFGRDQEFSTGYVQHRFRQITAGHIEKVLSGLNENTTLVKNTRAYLLSALFNSVSTIENHYTMLDNHDRHCFT